MTSATRSVLVGATLGILVVAAAVGALVLRSRSDSGGKESSAAVTKVVVVFAMPGEDDAVTAQVVALVDPANGRYEVRDTSATVSIPGTSYHLLRDAYPFGGAAAVASALAGGEIGPGTAWVDVSPEAWRRLLTSGVDVTITEPFDTYDEASGRYAEFEIGTQHVESADLRSLINGAAYLGDGARRQIVGDLATASLRGLASAAATQGIETDLGAEQWSVLTRSLRGK